MKRLRPSAPKPKPVDLSAVMGGLQAGVIIVSTEGLHGAWPTAHLLLGGPADWKLRETNLFFISNIQRSKQIMLRQLASKWKQLLNKMRILLA